MAYVTGNATTEYRTSEIEEKKKNGQQHVDKDHE
jgi:hypothetical protein